MKILKLKLLCILALLLPSQAMAVEYSLIENATDTIVRRAREFGSEDPRLLTHKFGPASTHRWVLTVRSAKPAFDADIEILTRVDTVTPTEHQITWTVTALTGPELDEAQRQKRLRNLEPDIPAIADKLRPVPAGGGGQSFDQLTNAEQTKIIRYLLLVNGFKS